MAAPQTGPMQFGEHRGVYIRGDHAMAYAVSLAMIRPEGVMRQQVQALRAVLRGENMPPQQAVLLNGAEATGMLFRLRFQKLGAHVHCRMFQRTDIGVTWQKNGDLTFDERAWSALRIILPLAGFDVLPEDEQTVRVDI